MTESINNNAVLQENIRRVLTAKMPDEKSIDAYANTLAQKDFAMVSMLEMKHYIGFLKAKRIVDALIEYGLADSETHKWLPVAFSTDYVPAAGVVPAATVTATPDTNTESKNDAASIEEIDTMSGSEFEGYLAKLFKHKGYDTEVTPLSGDYGIDLIIKNDLIRIGVQAKRYSDRVSLSAVQEALGGMRHYNLDKAMVVTSNYFQPSAVTLADENGVILWDRDKLIKEIEQNRAK